jgi:hypothetical protein
MPPKEVVKQWGILEWKDPLGLRGRGFFNIEKDKSRLQRGYWDKLSFLRQHNLPIPTGTWSSSRKAIPILPIRSATNYLQRRKCPYTSNENLIVDLVEATMPAWLHTTCLVDRQAIVS